MHWQRFSITKTRVPLLFLGEGWRARAKPVLVGVRLTREWPDNNHYQIKLSRYELKPFTSTDHRQQTRNVVFWKTPKSTLLLSFSGYETGIPHLRENSFSLNLRLDRLGWLTRKWKNIPLSTTFYNKFSLNLSPDGYREVRLSRLIMKNKETVQSA